MYHTTFSFLKQLGLTILLLGQCYNGIAQGGIPDALRPPHPRDKMVDRFYRIDAKRQSSSMYDDDAMPRSREFIRIDSTYYVGWMYEGVYKHEHAADYLGYKNAIAPLEHAMALLEHDYAKALATRTSDVMVYYPIYRLKVDYTLVADFLMNCYSNTEQPEKVYALLRRVIKYNLQRQYYLDAYDYLAWTTHRNRFYTTKKYGFLASSIQENEKLAGRYLDTAMMVIAKNETIHNQLEPYILESEKISVYHYKNILYSYQNEIDSAKKYFGLMEDNGRLPHNNFATFNAVSGNFSTAEEHYSIAANQDQGDKRLQEWAYYMGIINIYKADPKKSISIEKGMIKSNGITPGYGWYNIALARALCYDGQIAEAEKYAKKAAEFKEVHIGTTLGQTHYDFSIQLLQLIAMERHFAMLRFENSNWWYNPSILTQLAGNATEKYLQQLLLINQLAQNPERDQVIYNLFSNESTISWDEVWHLVKDYSTPYFIKKFSTQAQNDKRPKIRKYFKLFNAKLLIKQGKYKEAQTLLDAVLQDPDIDAEYEKLYLARIFEAQAICSKETGKETQAERWTMQLYTTFPQLIPFTDLKPKVVLQTDNSNKDPYYGKVIARLKDCNLNRIKTTSDPNALYFSVALTTSGKNKSLVYSVANSEGQSLLAPQTISCEQPDSDAVHLAYALFNVGGTKEKE